MITWDDNMGWYSMFEQNRLIGKVVAFCGLVKGTQN